MTPGVPRTWHLADVVVCRGPLTHGSQGTRAVAPFHMVILTGLLVAARRMCCVQSSVAIGNYRLSVHA